MPVASPVKIGNIVCGPGEPLLWIAGPCVMEPGDMTLLVAEMRSIPWMQDLGCPVIFDATHSVQKPAGAGDRSDGDRRMVPYLARAAVAAGCDGVFVETHPRPDQALSDGPNMIALDDLPALVECCLRLRAAL